MNGSVVCKEMDQRSMPHGLEPVSSENETAKQLNFARIDHR